MTTWPTIAVDERYGHVTIHDAGAYPNGLLAVIEDMGETCHVRPAPGHEVIALTEDQARDLGTALIGWAGRKRLARKGVRA